MTSLVLALSVDNNINTGLQAPWFGKTGRHCDGLKQSDKSVSQDPRISRVNSISVKSKVRLENLFRVLFQNFFTNFGRTLSKLTHNIIRKPGQVQKTKQE